MLTERQRYVLRMTIVCESCVSIVLPDNWKTSSKLILIQWNLINANFSHLAVLIIQTPNMMMKDNSAEHWLPFKVHCFTCKAVTYMDQCTASHV